MSLQDRLSSQDATQLLTVATSLSLVAMAGPTGSYNFPLFLFGIVAYEMHSSTVPLRQFLILVLFTALFDFLRIPSMSFLSLSGISSLLVLLLKAPIFFTCITQLRERGGDLRWGQGSWNFQGLGQRGQNWSMPGGFGGDQAASASSAPPPPPPGSFPSSGGFRLGSDEEDQNTTSGGPPPGPAPGRNGYQTIA